MEPDHEVGPMPVISALILESQFCNTVGKIFRALGINGS